MAMQMMTSVKHCEGSTPGIFQQIIGAAIGGSFLGRNLRFVGDGPAGMLKQLIDQYAGISFCGHRLHPSVFNKLRSMLSEYEIEPFTFLATLCRGS